MKITVFTSNQPRHIHLLKKLAGIAETVYAVQECNTVFPGQVKDFFNNSAVMQQYFQKVMQAEKNIFGQVSFLPSNVKSLAIKMKDLNQLPMSALSDAMHSDCYVVFGSSFIKGELIEFLVKNKALNIHMGVSPYFRGSSCNFWAAYLGRPDMVGATIHMLSAKLDAGDMLYHALPEAKETEAFDLGMQAVAAAHNSLTERLRTGEIFDFTPVAQDKTKEIKYTVNAEFNDEVAADYLEHLPSREQIQKKLAERDLSLFLRPYIG